MGCRGFILMFQTRESESSSSSADSTEAHKNEGFLKSAWHRLTNQHSNLTDDPKAEEKKAEKEDEEPKRASGSG